MAFSGILGHENEIDLLLSFLRKGRLPHAFLFTGQDGIGKKRIAVEFIKHILCESQSGCGTCLACVKIEHGNHPDLLSVTGENSIGIDQSRAIGREIHEYPFESDKRAILIDKAETMTREAANSLLKTLEEPPPYNVFFLITSSEREIPLTIRSRCVRVAFGPLRRDHLERYFRGVSGLDEKRARLLSHISSGSISFGQFWMEEGNVVLRRKLAELVTGKSRSFLNATLLCEQIGKNNNVMFMYLSFLLSLLKDMYVVREYRDSAMATNGDVRDLLDWEFIDAQWVCRAIKKVQETMAIMRYNTNRWLLFENLLLHIMR